MLVIVADSNVVRAASADSPPSPAGTDGGNNTAPPPVIPPPVPPQSQRPVEPGTITQGWDNGSPVSQVRDRRDVTLLNSTNETTYETAYGYFVLNKSAPYFVSVLSPDGTGTTIADSAFLVSFEGLLLQPAKGVIDKATPGELSFHYGLYLNGTLQGTMTVDYRFQQGKNNITASFAPLITLASQFKIVWLTFTSWDIIDVTTMPADVEQRFEDLRGYGGVLQFPPTYQVLSATGMVDTVVKPYKGADFNKEAAGLHLNVDDAIKDSPSTYAGKFSFGTHSGNAVFTTFAVGHLAIDPQLITGAFPQDAPSFSGLQRKTFFDGQRYWLFFIRSAENVISYTSSLDGKNWNPLSILVTTGGTLSQGFTVTNSGKTVVIVWIDSVSNDHIQIVSGAIQEDGIFWDATNNYYAGHTVVSPPSAALTLDGLGLGITYLFNSAISTTLVLQRFECSRGVGQVSSCGTQTAIGSGDNPTTVSAYAVVVALFGNYLAVFYAAGPDSSHTQFQGLIYSVNGGFVCQSTILSFTLAFTTDWYTHGLFTAATSVGPNGLYASLFFLNTVDGYIYQYDLDGSCNFPQDTTNPSAISAGTNAEFLTAGTEQDGQALYLFYITGSTGSRRINYLRVVPNQSLLIPATYIPFLAAYNESWYVTAASVSSNLSRLRLQEHGTLETLVGVRVVVELGVCTTSTILCRSTGRRPSTTRGPPNWEHR